MQIRNVGGGTFEIRLREEQVSVTPHKKETVDFLVVSAGSGKLACDLQYEVSVLWAACGHAQRHSRVTRMQAGSFEIEGQCTTYLGNWHTQTFSNLGGKGVTTPCVVAVLTL